MHVRQISIGGNDENFSGAIQNCYESRHLEAETYAPFSIPDTNAPRLVASYQNIANAMQHGTLYVMGYPRFFARVPDNSNCDVYKSDAEYITQLKGGRYRDCDGCRDCPSGDQRRWYPCPSRLRQQF